ncbi:MAG TPA: alpha/beta fold hydrolase [Planctomycetota bacterium]
MHSTTLASLLCITVLAAASPAQKEADAIVEPSLKVPRGKLLEWKSAQAKTYWYRLPKDIEPKNPPDLLIMLHGTGLNHGWSFWNYPILGDFRKRDIVVSPDGMTPGQGTTFNFVQGAKDGEQIAGLITDFKKRFPIGRVYLYGHSQGAFFCYWFAGEHPELIDGIVAHAGNVLDVKHGKLGKQKVAIGILHGRADAVVPVDCAIRTEKIYREQGYEKLKLEIVDGLTEQSGHWPLPIQVAKMLAWCDQVSTQSAAQAVRTAASELQRKQPDLAVIAEQWQKAKKLLPKGDDADKKDLPPQLDALGAFLDKTLAALSEKLLAEPAVLDPKAAYGPWVPRFLLADDWFAEHPTWKKGMQKPKDLANRHDKLVEKALKGLEKPTKDSRAAAAKAYEEAFLSARAGELFETLAKTLADAGAAEAENMKRVGDVKADRDKAAAEAAKEAAELLAPMLEALKTAAPALFASDGNGDGK